MCDNAMKRYNEYVELVENCVDDILQTFDIFVDNEDYKTEDLYRDLSLRLSYFSLEVLSKFSH